MRRHRATLLLGRSASGIALLLLAAGVSTATPASRHAVRLPTSSARTTSEVHRGSWPDGKAKFEYEYRNGLLDGVSREWFPSGALWREQRYVAGHEAGLQRMYWEDGRVRASYVIRDGRRYGLMGTKGCVTKTDSLEVLR